MRLRLGKKGGMQMVHPQLLFGVLIARGMKPVLAPARVRKKKGWTRERSNTTYPTLQCVIELHFYLLPHPYAAIGSGWGIYITCCDHVLCFMPMAINTCSNQPAKRDTFWLMGKRGKCPATTCTGVFVSKNWVLSSSSLLPVQLLNSCDHLCQLLNMGSLY